MIGLEPFNLALLEDLAGPHEVEFLEALSQEEAVGVSEEFRLEDLVDLAQERIEANGPADAILNYWDFPGCCIAPILCERAGLPTASSQSIAALEHKYWARTVMAEAVPEVSKDFCVVDPFAERPRKMVEIDYPFWVKPFVSHSSYLSFKVETEEDLSEAMGHMRDGIGLFGNPFNEFLARVDMPEGMESIGGNHCIAEKSIAADRQVTLEGYVHEGEVSFYGAVDSVRDGGIGSSFARYQYPSSLPEPVLARMRDATSRLLKQVGYDNAPFNSEFFYDEETDRISMLEVNTRLSKSHAAQFRNVDGRANFQVGLDLALGKAPDFPQGEGDWPLSAKMMLRLFQDGKVERVPTQTEIHHMQARYPELLLQVLVDKGQRLSHLAFQDSYSFELADVVIGGKDDRELAEKYADIIENLPFTVNLTAPIPQ